VTRSNGKCRHADIDHGVVHILARAPVEKT
jgi:hypothetical protein